MNRANRILNSLDDLQKATAPDFFYARLTGRMQEEMEPEKRTFFLLRPAFITAALLLVLIINVVSLSLLNKQPEQKTSLPSNKAPTIESFAKAYGMNTESVYE